MALDHLDECLSAYAAAQAIGPMVDVHPESLRQWILKAQARPGKPVAAAKTAEQLELDADRRPMAALRAGFLLGSALRRAGHTAEAERTLAPLTQRCMSLDLVRLPTDASAP